MTHILNSISWKFFSEICSFTVIAWRSLFFFSRWIQLLLQDLLVQTNMNVECFMVTCVHWLDDLCSPFLSFSRWMQRSSSAILSSDLKRERKTHDYLESCHVVNANLCECKLMWISHHIFILCRLIPRYVYSIFSLHVTVLFCCCLEWAWSMEAFCLLPIGAVLNLLVAVILFMHTFL